MRKPHGPQKGLPNSARDLLPMLQPATKALAQMLAGRTPVSGQLEQARAMLSQAERLIADRVHNRLNPAEREEFFEQLARLRLTLADAAEEAETRAAEEQAPPRPVAPPVAQERLKEMALALATPDGSRRRAWSGAEEGAAGPRSTVEDVEGQVPGPMAEAEAPGSAAGEDHDQAGGAAAEADAGEAAAAAPEGPRRLLAINKAGRLELPRDAAANASQSLSLGRGQGGVARRRLSTGKPPTAAGATAPGPEAEPATAGAAADPEHAGNGTSVEAAERATTSRRSRKTKAGLPEGWIIDEEGFVVPGPS